MKQLILISSFVFLSSCSTLGYLWQAGKGQLEMSNRARPIKEVIEDPRTPPDLKSLLEETEQINAFARASGLTPTQNYTEYVQLDREAATWVVSASRPLEFSPKTWGFPIVGSFTYLGWFDLEDAKQHGESLKKEGWDVYVRGASAYSTLGWFRDPILSTMISKGEDALSRLVDVLLHESVHATFYVNHQSYFNESIANFVAKKLTESYLLKTRGRDSEDLDRFRKSLAESSRRSRLLHQGYKKLDELYRSSESDEEKKKKKNEILQKLKQQLGYRREINNAFLIQFRTYGLGEEEFEQFFESCEEDWSRFWKKIQTITPETFSQKQSEDFGQILVRFARQGCSV